MAECDDCNMTLKPDEAICVRSAHNSDKCSVCQEKCEEVYCLKCWENE